MIFIYNEELGEEKAAEMLAKSTIIENKNENDETWQRIKNSMTNTAEKEIGYYMGNKAKKSWVTIEMIKKTDERRQYKNKKGGNNREF